MEPDELRLLFEVLFDIRADLQHVVWLLEEDDDEEEEADS